MEEPRGPSFHYYVEESDPDVMILRHQDDSFVIAFRAQGVTKEEIGEAAKENCRRLPQTFWPTQGEAAEAHRSA